MPPLHHIKWMTLGAGDLQELRRWLGLAWPGTALDWFQLNGPLIADLDRNPDFEQLAGKIGRECWNEPGDSLQGNHQLDGF